MKRLQLLTHYNIHKNMRLFHRNGWYYVAFDRGKERSLRTQDKKKATALYIEIEKEQLRGRFIQLDKARRITIREFITEYTDNRKDKDFDTLRADKLALNTLADILGEASALRAVNSQKLDYIKSILVSRGLKPTTINTYFRHMRSALNTAVEWGYIKQPVKFNFVRVPRRNPLVFDKKQIKDIKEYAKNKDYEMYRIIVFALWTGCRREEILTVNYQDIKNGSCRIIGKGDKERSVPLSNSEELWETIGDQHIGRVFVRWHLDTVSKRFRLILDKCGIPVEYHFHNLRHSAATYMLSNGIPLPVVQKILGHTDMRTTLIYADVLDEVQKTEIQKLKFD